MGIVVEDIVDLMVDTSFQKVQIWDLEKEEIVFSGVAEDIPEKYLIKECTIDSVVNNTICFNVN